MVAGNVVINVSIPGINRSHNFIVPNDMQIDRVIFLISKTLKDEYPSVKCESMVKLRLLLKQTGQILNPSCSLKQLDINDGTDLILA